MYIRSYRSNTWVQLFFSQCKDCQLKLSIGRIWEGAGVSLNTNTCRRWLWVWWCELFMLCVSTATLIFLTNILFSSYTPPFRANFTEWEPFHICWWSVCNDLFGSRAPTCVSRWSVSQCCTRNCGSLQRWLHVYLWLQPNWKCWRWNGYFNDQSEQR